MSLSYEKLALLLCMLFYNHWKWTARKSDFLFAFDIH